MTIGNKTRFHQEFFKAETPEHDKLVLDCIKGKKEIFSYVIRMNNLPPPVNLEEIKYHTEEICFNNGFIIGYIDLIFSGLVTHAGKVDIIIECKPIFKEFGGVLRQIKTYVQFGKHYNADKTYGCVITNHSVTTSEINLFLNEGITLLSLHPDSPLPPLPTTPGGPHS